MTPQPIIFPVLRQLGKGAKLIVPRPTIKQGPLIISGVTRNSAGVALGTCVVDLYRTANDQFVEKTTSDVSGNFTFYTVGPGQTYYIVAYKAGSPDVAGTTVNTIQGVSPIATVAPSTPYVNRVQYASVLQAASHNVVFPTPVAGNLLLLFAYTDKGAMTTPSGWTLDLTKTSGTQNLAVFKKIAAGTEGTVTIPCVASIMGAVGFEFSGGFLGTVDDNGVILLNQANLTNLLTSAITTVAVDLVFGVAGFFNTGHVNTGDGPFSFDSSFVQLGYALAVQDNSSTSTISIELVVGYRKTSSTGTYSTTITATTTEAATSSPGLIIAYK